MRAFNSDANNAATAIARGMLYATYRR